MFTKFSVPIIESQNICIFRHSQPDGDAVCSQLALKAWIEQNFRDKTVKIMGHDLFDAYPYVDEVDDEFIKSSLAIVLDTANRERIDDDRYKLAKKVMKIDHHPVVDDFGDINIVNTRSAATAELLTILFLDGDVIGYRVNEECAKYLYAGILYDTQSFTTSNTSQWTLNAASSLAETGIDINQLYTKVFNKSLNSFNSATKIRQKLQYSDGVGYVIMNAEELSELGISPVEAKRCVSEFNNVDELKIWLIACEMAKGSFDISMRSKKDYVINELAASFNGGGHANACGIKGLSLAEVNNVIKEATSLVKTIDIKD